jgi:hypothetical protein
MSFKTKYYATIMSRPENKLNVAEIRVLRWMNGHIRQDKIRNDNIRERERERHSIYCGKDGRISPQVV